MEGGLGRSSGPGPTLALRGTLMAVGGGSRLLVARRGEQRDDALFVYDCANVEKKALGNKGQDGQPADKGSDNILAFAFSPSGDYFVLTDDSKQLILFRTKPSWECISIRPVNRRCTSLVITVAEDKILVADKSGDVYSYSITEPQAEGKFELGHLSMLLDAALSPDDRYILTADRDEKIRVSLTKAPYNIVSYCLGHEESQNMLNSLCLAADLIEDNYSLPGMFFHKVTQHGAVNLLYREQELKFVSRIFVVPNYPDLLLSASGDCTLRLWKYETGEEIYCCQLSSICGSETTKMDQNMFRVGRYGFTHMQAENGGNPAGILAVHHYLPFTTNKYIVSRIAYCCQGSYVAILCDCIPTVYIFQLDAVAQQLVYREQISLKHKCWDIAFEETGEIWILQEDNEAPLQLYRPCDGQWKSVTDDEELQRMSKYLLDNWTAFEGFVGAESHYSSLYKASFDNMAVYLQRKEERIQKQKKKRQNLQHDANGQTKKIKTEESSL